MEPAKTGIKPELGIGLKGVVMAKNTYIQKSTGEEKFQVDIACPGNRENITLGVTKADYESYNEMDKFDKRVSVSSYNGNISFQLM